MTDTGFEIDGKSYEVALPSTFDMDEAQIFYEYTGFVVEEIWLGGGEDLTRRPGFLAALAHISFRRGNETAENDEIRMSPSKLRTWRNQKLFTKKFLACTTCCTGYR